MKRFCSFAVAALIYGSFLPTALAQTARIGHLSRSGSLEKLDAAVDNFGIPPSHFEADSIEILTDSTAREYGKWVGYHKPEKVTEVQFAHARYGYGKTVRQYIASRQQSRPHLKVIRRDSVTAHTVSSPATELKKQKVKRKKSAFAPAAPAPPQHPGVALGVALILCLGGAGWLLGERQQVTASS